jgi:KRAB domain-containing zinc finger protein
MCLKCKEFFKTKQDLLSHSVNCVSKSDYQVLTEPVINTYFIKIFSLTIVLVLKQPQNTTPDPMMPMSIEKMRFLIAILLKKISSDKKLKELGFEKVNTNFIEISRKNSYQFFFHYSDLLIT